MDSYRVLMGHKKDSILGIWNILALLTFDSSIFYVSVVKAKAWPTYLLICIRHPMHWRSFASQLWGLHQSPR